MYWCSVTLGPASFPKQRCCDTGVQRKDQTDLAAAVRRTAGTIIGEAAQARVTHSLIRRNGRLLAAVSHVGKAAW